MYRCAQGFKFLKGFKFRGVYLCAFINKDRDLKHKA